jgi:hypothetical protein
MTLDYVVVGTILKRPWKLLGTLKLKILAWPRVKTKKNPCSMTWNIGLGMGQSLKYYIVRGLHNLWVTLC